MERIDVEYALSAQESLLSVGCLCSYYVLGHQIEPVDCIEIAQVKISSFLPPSRVSPKQRAAEMGRFNSPHKDPSVSYWFSGA